MRIGSATLSIGTAVDSLPGNVGEKAMKHPLLFATVSKALLLTSVTAPAMAEDHPLLWRDISAGTTSEQLATLYPPVKGLVKHKKGFSIIEGVQKFGECSPSVNVSHYDGAVTSVIVQSKERGFLGGTCGDEAENALLSKYGKPLSRDESSTKVNGLYSGGAVGRDVRQIKMSWTSGSVIVTFKRDDPDLDDRWSITYEEVKDMGL